MFSLFSRKRLVAECSNFLDDIQGVQGQVCVVKFWDPCYPDPDYPDNPDFSRNGISRQPIELET